jgi:tetratricopeptide (TPR) repeat protein
MKRMWMIAVLGMAATLCWAQPPGPAAGMARELVRSGTDKRAAGDWNGALRDFETALALDDRNADAYANRGYIRGFAAPDAAKNMPAALADFERAYALDSTRHDYLNMRGLLYLRTRMYPEALVAITQALRRDPQNPAYLTNRGAIYFYLKQDSLGCADLRTAAALGNAGARQLLAKHCK